MPVEIPDELRNLAKIFPCRLYAVGGFVRDSLLGYAAKDVDLAGAASPEEVFSALADSGFSVKTGSKKLFTLIIKGEKEYEYTSFRKDSYTSGHRPSSSCLCGDIKLDASRRDFTVNAIYYDVRNGALIDFYDGIGDLKRKLIRTTRNPGDVFSEDGLRLMRLARFTAALGFSADNAALDSAKSNASLIDDISPERIRAELDKILVADTFYDVKNAQTRGLEILRETKVLERILPEITDGEGMAQRADFHKYDVYNHILATVGCAPADIRLAALMHDVGKPYCMKTTGRFHGHETVGAELTRQILARLRYPNAVISETARLVLYHMFNLLNDARANIVRLFVLKNRDIIDKLVELKYADYYGSGTAQSDKLPSADRIKNEYGKMLAEKIPFSVSELAVNGNDLEKTENIPINKRSDVLNALLRECALENSPYLTREKQLEFLKKYTEDR
jgi:putative nucleotidyltransferase with HDIG domain